VALRKGQPVAEPLVRIAEVLAELGGGGNPGIWRAEAEELAQPAAGAAGQVAGCPPAGCWADLMAR
jgi:hypothetical protein